MKNKKNIIIVNSITSLRMLGIFLLIPIYFLYGGLGLALTNIICFLTDFIDGKMAKKLNASTFFGSFYDGFSDKAFVAMNFLILALITPWALVPVIFELGIAGIQYLKFKNNLNVQSNMVGKVKMWVIGLMVVISNLLLSMDSLTFLGNDLINKLASLKNNNIVKICLLPILLSEVLTLSSYIKEYKDEKKEEVREVKKEEVKKEEEISNDYTLKEILFDPDIYKEYKNDSALKLIRQRKK